MIYRRNNRSDTEDVEMRSSTRRAIPIQQKPADLALEPHRQTEQDPRQRPVSDPAEEETQGVYIISVAARLLEMHPQTLRKYERLGLVQPSRTIGMLRLYSNEDLEKLRLIRHLETNLGMNLAGVDFILNLLDNLIEMRRRIDLQARVQAMHTIMEQEMKRLFEQLNLPFQQ